MQASHGLGTLGLKIRRLFFVLGLGRRSPGRGGTNHDLEMNHVLRPIRNQHTVFSFHYRLLDGHIDHLNVGRWKVSTCVKFFDCVSLCSRILKQ